MNDWNTKAKLELLFSQIDNCQRELSGMANQYECGGNRSNVAVKRLKEILSHQIRYILSELVQLQGEECNFAEKGANLLCTAVRLSEISFTRDERINWFEGFLKYADTFNDNKFKGQFFGNYGNVLADTGRLNEAGKVLNRRLKIAYEEDDLDSKGIAKEHLGKLYLRQGRFKEADQVLSEAIEIAEKTGNETASIRMLKEKADASYRNGQISNCIETLELRLEKAESLEDPLLILSSRHFLSEKLLVIGNIKDSKILAKSAMKLAKNLKLPEKIAELNGTLGNIAYDEGAYLRAEKYYRLARKIFLKHHRVVELGAASNGLGLALWKQGKLNNSVKYFNEALEIDRAAGRKNDEAIDLGNLALVRIEIGDIKAAINHYSERIQVLEDIKEYSRLAETQMKLAQLHASYENYDLAISLGKESLVYYSGKNKDKTEFIQSFIIHCQNSCKLS